MSEWEEDGLRLDHETHAAPTPPPAEPSAEAMEMLRSWVPACYLVAAALRLDALAQKRYDAGWDAANEQAARVAERWARGGQIAKAIRALKGKR